MTGRHLELNHVALLLAIAFWGWIWGVSGIVLAVPLPVNLVQRPVIYLMIAMD